MLVKSNQWKKKGGRGRLNAFQISVSILGVVAGIIFHNLILVFSCYYVVYIVLVGSSHLLHSDFALAPHNSILESLTFRWFSLYDTNLWGYNQQYLEGILNLMKATTNKSQNLFSWNKNQKCFNTTGPRYDSNVTNCSTNLSLQKNTENFCA